MLGSFELGPIIGYSYVKNIIISGYRGSSDLASFSFLFNESGQTYLKTIGNGGNITDSDGYDIVFTDQNNVQLDHEIELYNGTNGDFIAWVRIPILDYNKNTKIRIHYSNDAISSSQENIDDVWDTNFKGVWHLKEDGDGTEDEFKDSTDNNNHGQGGAGDEEATPTLITSGKIGNAQDFNGTSEYIDLGNDRDFVSGVSAVTLSMWIYVDTVADSDQLLSFSINNNGLGTSSSRVNISRVGTEINMLIKGADGGGDTQTIKTTTDPITVGAWYYVVGVVGISTDFGAIYINGISQTIESMPTFANTATTNTSSDNAAIGAEDDGSGGFIEGRIDEVRFSIIARSADWITASHNNQSSPSTFYTVLDI